MSISLDGIDEVGCLWYHFTTDTVVPGPLSSLIAVLQVWLLGVSATSVSSCILIINIIGAGP